MAFGRKWKFSGHRYPLRRSKVNVRYNNVRILPNTESADNELYQISLKSSKISYPFLSWLLKPCPINAMLNRSQRHFNKTLSSARSTVERAFAILKGRWRILLKRIDCSLYNVSEIILTCCILHKFIKKQDKILMMTKFHRGSSLLRENIYRLGISRTLPKILLRKIFASPSSSICCKIETDIFLSEHVPYFASQFNFIYLINPLHELKKNFT